MHPPPTHAPTTLQINVGKRCNQACRHCHVDASPTRTETMPESPSTIVKNLDPAVERVIERCLSVEPRERPASALQVAAALPGGDPLAAALAAGETPSPEMVAAAAKEGSLRPPLALALLALAFVGLALSVYLTRGLFLHNLVPLEKSAQGLRE